MNKQTKIALIGLVILILFFAGTVGLGFREGNDDKGSINSEPPKWTKSLGGILPSPSIPSVTLNEMGLEGKGNELTINKRANITFLESEEEYRKIDVKWLSGYPVKLTFDGNSTTIGPKEKEEQIIVSNENEGGSLRLTSGQSSASVEFVGSK